MVSKTLALVSNTEVLAVDQDPLGVQGSLVNSGGDDASPCGACETYAPCMTRMPVCLVSN